MGFKDFLNCKSIKFKLTFLRLNFINFRLPDSQMFTATGFMGLTHTLPEMKKQVILHAWIQRGGGGGAGGPDHPGKSQSYRIP